jgi:hypothetical protein
MFFSISKFIILSLWRKLALTRPSLRAFENVYFMHLICIELNRKEVMALPSYEIYQLIIET